MKVFRGKVVSKIGEVQHWMKELEKDYSDKTGIRLFRQTINIQLDEPFQIPTNAIYLHNGPRSKDKRQIRVLPCYLNDTKVFLLRKETRKLLENEHSQTIIEIAVDPETRQSLKLEYGDVVKVAIPITAENMARAFKS